MGVVDGLRVLVVGGSRGLGRAFAQRLLDEGAHVVAAARTFDPNAEPGARLHHLTCDVRDPDACRETVTAAVALLGGLDALVYAPGTTVVTELEHATAEHWHDVMATNVVGAALVTAAAIPHLEASDGVAVYLSSVSAHVTPPWIGMGLYAASKVALEKSVEVWKLEHPRVRFTTIVIGSTSGGTFFAGAAVPNPADAPRFQAEWRARGYLAQQQLEPDDQAHALLVLTSRAQIDVVWVRPKGLLQLWE
jgi:NAD(P)-dependent dehydrogenase (short-subunit alcohol dehydrogenase family)